MVRETMALKAAVLAILMRPIRAVMLAQKRTERRGRAVFETCVCVEISMAGSNGGEVGAEGAGVLVDSRSGKELVQGVQMRWSGTHVGQEVREW